MVVAAGHHDDVRRLDGVEGGGVERRLLAHPVAGEAGACCVCLLAILVHAGWYAAGVTSAASGRNPRVQGWRVADTARQSPELGDTRTQGGECGAYRPTGQLDVRRATWMIRYSASVTVQVKNTNTFVETALFDDLAIDDEFHSTTIGISQIVSDSGVENFTDHFDTDAL